ncbi:MAG TPA: aminotransferase class V-fold PLP-dependent enzyme [Longimicrobiales bacterium]
MTVRGTAFAEIRAREFAWPSGRTYMNAAGFGPLPGSSRLAIADFDDRRWRVELTDPDLTAPLVAARASAAQLIGADADEIALVPNTNIGINIAATAASKLCDVRRTILIHDREFPANVYPWLELEQHGFKVELITTDTNGLPREAVMLERIARGDVAAISVSFVQFASGFRADLNTLGQACRAAGTLFVVDAIQGVGAIPLDVRTAQIDILACGGQKWLCGPWGSGFAYVRRELIGRFQPLLPGWISFKATQDFTRLLDYQYDMLDDARRFETGSLGFQDYLGLNQSLRLLLGMGVDQIWAHIRELQAPIIDWSQNRAVPIVSDLREPRRSGILCIRPPDPDRVYQALSDAQIRCSLRENSIRLSPHWYNTMADVERVIAVLESTVS